jgi:KDO2-lipid IV(A) lauroyltransferase
VIEGAALAVFSAVVRALPERAAVWMGRAMGRATWLLSPGRRRRAIRHMRAAMGDELTDEEVQRLVRQVFTHFGLTLVETLWASRRLETVYGEERFPVDGNEAARAVVAEGDGALVICAHVGNWEVFGGVEAHRFGGLTALARPIRNPFINRRLARVRERGRIREIHPKGSVRPILAALRNGDVVVVLLDQHVKTAYVPTTFFGIGAATSTVVAALALRCRVPVFLAYSFRQGQSFRHHGFLEGPLELIETGDRDEDVRANTQMFNDRLEAAIRKHPEQWLWTQRRWRLDANLRRDGRETETVDCEAAGVTQYGNG